MNGDYSLMQLTVVCGSPKLLLHACTQGHNHKAQGHNHKAQWARPKIKKEHKKAISVDKIGPVFSQSRVSNFGFHSCFC